MPRTYPVPPPGRQPVIDPDPIRLGVHPGALLFLLFAVAFLLTVIVAGALLAPPPPIPVYLCPPTAIVA